jgi:hypothetical protein
LNARPLSWQDGHLYSSRWSGRDDPMVRCTALSATILFANATR